MSFFYHGEPPNSTKRCRFLTSTLLKDAFAYCHTGHRHQHRRLSSSKPKEEDSASDMDGKQDELEVVTDAVVVSEIRSRAMEAKSRRKASFTIINGFSRVFSPATGELFVAPKAVRKNDEGDDREGREEFFSVGSCFSRCSSATSMEAFVSVKTSFSRCSSLSKLDRRRDFRQPFVVQEFWQDGLDCQDLRRRSFIQEFYHCEGWPFGFCRKALLLPPLPKSPSESWSWSKGARLVKLP